MFTGIIEEVGEVLWIRASDRGTQLQLVAPKLAAEIHTGDSISVNGCCLTASGHRAERMTFDLLAETLERSNLKNLRPGGRVNLERPLSAVSRLGGHFVQGHVDCATAIVDTSEKGADLRLEVALPSQFAHLVADKGSVAINGISLTIAEVLPRSFVVWIIPHTRRATNLAGVAQGEFVNIEFDILAKYVERMLTRKTPESD